MVHFPFCYSSQYSVFQSEIYLFFYCLFLCPGQMPGEIKLDRIVFVMTLGLEITLKIHLPWDNM